MNDVEIRNEEICPNCMEPVPADAAACPFCGASMTESAGSGEIQMMDGVIEPAQSPDEAETAEKGDAQGADEKGKKPSVMQNITRGMGVYLIYIALTQGYNVIAKPASLELEVGTKNYWLALVSNVIYLAAGLLAVWPWIKEYLDKRKRVEDAIAAEQDGVVVDGNAEEIEAEDEAVEEPDLDEIRRAADAELKSDVSDETE